MKTMFDKMIEKAISRKLMAWLVATGLMFIDKIDGDQWILVTSLYIGTQATIDGVAKLLEAKK